MKQEKTLMKNDHNHICVIVWLFAVLVLFCGCTKKALTEQTYQSIDAETAYKMMNEESGCLIVDVRRPVEFEEGHIPGSVNIPLDTLKYEIPEELKNAEGPVLLYCRSGRRSKEAAGILQGQISAPLYEFGGIIDWPYEIVQ